MKTNEKKTQKNDLPLYVSKQYVEYYIKNQYNSLALIEAIISDSIQPNKSINNEYLKAYWQEDKFKGKKLIIKVKNKMDNLERPIRTVVVLSGGMDSVTLLHKIKAEGKEVKAISFNYGQIHVKELEMAKQQCELLDINHKVVDISFLKDLLPSALTGKQEVPQGHYEDESMKQTVVPFRNSILATISLGYTVGIDFDEIALGVHAGDHQIYPDCRPAFIGALRYLASLGDYKAISVYTPFLNVTKVDILAEGIKLGVDYSKTWTSYSSSDIPDYKTGSSVERTQAFIANGVKDPLYTDEVWQEAVKYANEIKPNV